VPFAPDGYQASERQAQNNQGIQFERRNKISVCHLVQSTSRPATGAVKTCEYMEQAGRQQWSRSRINQKKQEPYRSDRNRSRYRGMHGWDSIKGKPYLRGRRDLVLVIHKPTLEKQEMRARRRHSENIVKKFNPSYV
jgi:hypothetical protein